MAEALLDPGEELLGYCLGTQQSSFKAGQAVIVTTPGRLVVQAMTRKFVAKGDPISITPERIAKVSIDGAGGGWMTVNSAIMDSSAVTLKLRTTDGEKLKLMMMRGGAGDLLGRMGGGEAQEQGVTAVGEWFERHAGSARGDG